MSNPPPKKQAPENKRPGAGAINRGKNAGCEIENGKVIPELPTTGKINKGPGAGAINQGERAGCIIKSNTELAPDNTDGGKINENEIDINKKEPRSTTGGKHGARSTTEEINFQVSENDLTKTEKEVSEKRGPPKGNFNIGDGAGRANGTFRESVDIDFTGPPTGNINRGPGAGAINQGARSASIIRHTGAINFQTSEYEKSKVPDKGNINKGPGAGGDNRGTESASIINSTKPTW